MMRKLERAIPRYAWLPLLSLIAANLVAYYGSRLFTLGAQRFELSTPLDARVPFWPCMVVPYVLAYAQWALGFIVIARESRARCDRVISGELIAKLICLIAFVALPTTISRPEVTGDGLCERLVRLIYRMDAPVNLLPSIHCLDSWFCWRGAFGARRVPRGYKAGMLMLTLAVFASTVMIRQHVLLDVVAALIAAEAGLYLSRRLNAGRIFARMRREGRQ